MEKGAKRIYGFDYLRCLAAFSVVCIHVSFTNDFLRVNKTLHNYAVPVFILISFFLFNSVLLRPMKEAFRKSFVKLAPPYFFWTFIYLSLGCVGSWSANKPFEVSLSDIFLGESAVQLWFLPALFLWQVILILFKRIETVSLLMFLAGLSLFLYLFCERNVGLDYGFIKLFLFHAPFVFIGRLVYLKREVFFGISPLLRSGLFFLTLYGIYFFDTFSLGYSLCLIVYSIVIFLFFLNGKFIERRMIVSLSNNSFGIYLVHFGIYQCLVFAQKIVGIDNSTVALTMLNCIVTFMLSYGLSLTLHKWNFTSKMV